MKGLLIKDYYLLLQQKTLFFIIVCFAICLGISSDNAVFAMSFIMFIFSLLAGSTISYDEYNHGYTFLFTLPVTRKTYVREKYILSMMTCLCGWIMGCMTILLSSLLYGTIDNTGNILSLSGYLLPVLLLLQCINLPIQLKFGAEKGRIVLFLLIGGVILSATLLLKLPVFYSNVLTILNMVLALPIFPLLVVFFLLIATSLSYIYSCHIMQNREF